LHATGGSVFLDALSPGSPPRWGGHGLTVEEVRLLEKAAAGLLSHGRFVQPMRRFLVNHFREKHPALAGKLHRMSLGQFEVLCRHIR
jgi:hypothetical protein